MQYVDFKDWITPCYICFKVDVEFSDREKEGLI